MAGRSNGGSDQHGSVGASQNIDSFDALEHHRGQVAQGVIGGLVSMKSP